MQNTNLQSHWKNQQNQSLEANLGKICTACKQFKLYSDFYARHDVPDGRKSNCKACDNAKRQAKRNDPIKGELIREKERIAAQQKRLLDGGESARLAMQKYRSKPEGKAKQLEASRNWYKNKGKPLCLAHNAKRYAMQTQQTPAWANSDAIKEIYIQAQEITNKTGILHEVDHIIPLNGKTVKGLHVETNLRIIPKAENRAKRNFFIESLV